MKPTPAVGRRVEGSTPAVSYPQPISRGGRWNNDTSEWPDVYEPGCYFCNAGLSPHLHVEPREL